MKKRGFTLIELLVVVLIIGILSAIALPQYTVAVERSRMAEAMQNVSSLRKAIDIYLMENDWPTGNVIFLGKQANMAGVLNIDLESSLDCTVSIPNFSGGGSACGSKYYMYEANCSTSECNIYVNRVQNNQADYWMWWQKTKASGQWTDVGTMRCFTSYSKKLATSSSTFVVGSAESCQ